MIPRALTTISILYKRALLVFYAEEPDAQFRVMMMMVMMVMRMMMFFPKQADRQALPYLPYCGTAVSEQPKAGGARGRLESLVLVRILACRCPSH